jgi:type II secretory pathway component GspD/PulD (secretin)
MIKTTTLLAALILAAGAFGQTEQKQADPETPKPTLVSVSSKGHDVRLILHDMFKQAEKSFVLEPNIRFELHLSLEKVEFEEALRLVLKLASLRADVQNGIYFIGKPKAGASTAATTEVKGAFKAKPTAPKGKLPASALDKRITTRFDKIDIRLLLANLTQQTGVPFEISPDIPAYKLDAYLIHTSLKFALDTICGAAKLEYKLTDNMTISISKKETENRVALVGG